MPVQIQFRRDTAANWTSTNPTLAIGEIGLETDTTKWKLGNGSTAWNSLAYAYAAGATGPTGPAGATGPTGAVGATGSVAFFLSSVHEPALRAITTAAKGKADFKNIGCLLI